MVSVPYQGTERNAFLEHLYLIGVQSGNVGENSRVAGST